MDYLFENNFLRFEANPHYYDYIHNIVLYSDKTFELCDGAAQMINSIYKGTYKIENNQIIFYFKIWQNPYEKTDKIFLNKTIIINYRLIEEEKEHYNGYCLKKSHYTLHFDKSPFLLDEANNSIETVETSVKKYNLFNVLQDESYPTIFYTKFNFIKEYDKYYYQVKDIYQNLIEIIDADNQIPDIFKIKLKEHNGLNYLKKYSEKTKEILNQRFKYSIILYAKDEEYIFTIDKYTLVYLNKENVYLYVIESPNDVNKDAYKKLKILDLIKDSDEINYRIFNWKFGLLSMKEFNNLVINYL